MCVAECARCGYCVSGSWACTVLFAASRATSCSSWIGCSVRPCEETHSARLESILTLSFHHFCLERASHDCQPAFCRLGESSVLPVRSLSRAGPFAPVWKLHRHPAFKARTHRYCSFAATFTRGGGEVSPCAGYTRLCFLHDASTSADRKGPRRMHLGPLGKSESLSECPHTQRALQNHWATYLRS